MGFSVDSGLIGLVWLVTVGAIAIAISLILFDILRPRILDVYDRRRRALPHNLIGFPLDDGRHQAPPQPSLRPFAWIYHTLFLPDNDIITTHGLDTFMVLRFFHAMSRLCSRIGFFTIVFLIPTYITGSNKSLSDSQPLRVIGIRILSLANVPSDNWRMIFTVIADIIISVYVLIFMVHEVHFLSILRREYRASDHASNRALIVQDIPPDMASPQSVFEVWNSLFPGAIEGVRVVPDCSKLDKFREEYWNCVRHRQRAEALVRRASEREQSHAKNATKGSLISRLFPCLRKSENETSSASQRSSRPPSIASISPSKQDASNSLKRVFSKFQKQPPLQKFQEKTGNLKNMKALPDWINPSQAASAWKLKERDLLNEVESCLQSADVQNVGNTSSAIVLFMRAQDARLAVQSNFSSVWMNWTVTSAPDERAILWDMFGKSPQINVAKTVIAIVLMSVLTMFWVVPTGFIVSLANIEALSNTGAFSWLNFIASISPEISGFVEGLLPSMILEIVMITVPKVVYRIVKLQRLPSEVVVQQEALRKMIVFLFFSHVIFVVISGSILNHFDTFVQNPADIVRIMAASIPEQGTLMMTVVLLAAIVQVPIELLQPKRLFKRWIGMKRALTIRDKELVNAAESESDHFDSYSTGAIFAVIGIVYSTLTPLIMTICALFFMMKYMVLKYTLLFTQTSPWEGFAALHHIALHRVTLGLLMKHMTMAGLMGLNKQPILAVTETVCGFIIFFIMRICTKKILSMLENGALIDLSNCTGKREFSEPRFFCSPGKSICEIYTHPSLFPLQQLEGEEEIMA